MRIFALSDLHLSLSCEKPMDVFGDVWKDHAGQIEENWQKTVSGEDIVLVAGDISWAMSMAEAADDLAFLGRLNGTKIILRGNHDYWWSSVTKVRSAVSDSILVVQNNSFCVGDYAIGGTRLWNIPNEETKPEDIKIYDREMERLKLTLGSMPDGKIKIVMTHFPPLDPVNPETPATAIMKEHGVSTVVYGHLHGRAHHAAVTGEHDGIRYVLSSADYLKFTPVQIF
ncbi:MAG: metallophosphoesterase [Clostridia bacterium]|nr:metallophosphoesterase [Clostridia bacterium]